MHIMKHYTVLKKLSALLFMWNNNLQDKMLSEKKSSPFSMIHLWKRKQGKKNVYCLQLEIYTENL